MVNLGTWRTQTLEDDWTVITADGELSAHFEHTLLVTEDGVEVLTAPVNGRGRGYGEEGEHRGRRHSR